MKSESKMRIKLAALLLAIVNLSLAAQTDSLPAMFSRPVEWRIGAEVVPAWVPGTNPYLAGGNPDGKHIGTNLHEALRCEFNFNPATRQGMLYRGLYQGIGIGMNSFFPGNLLGTPVSAYVYQGAPIVSFGERLSLGYDTDSESLRIHRISCWE